MECIEIEPTKTVLVIGPSFTAAILTENANVNQDNLTSTSSQLLEIGISLLLEAEEYYSEADKNKCCTLYRNAYELDPLFAIKKLSSSLQKCNKYVSWLQRAFDTECTLLGDVSCLGKMKALQEQGVLIIYTHYDDLLCRLTHTKPILLNDNINFDKWCQNKSDGILYLNGVFSQPESVLFDCPDVSSPLHPLCNAASKLTSILQSKRVLCMGFDFVTEDPLLTQFTEHYLSKVSRSLQLNRISNAIDLNCVHSVAFPTSHQDSILSHLQPLDSSSKALWCQIELPPCNDQSLALCLLLSNKEGAIDVSSMLSNYPGVNFALMSSCTHNGVALQTVSVRVERPKKMQLLDKVLGKDKETLLSKGLLAVVFQCGTFLWMKQKPDFEIPQHMDALPSLVTTPIAPPTTDRIPAFDTEHHTSSTLELNFSNSTSAKRVPRYTMHHVRPRPKPYTIPRPGVSPGNLVPSARSLLERRASLPVNAMMADNTQALERLANSFTTPGQNHCLPSYAAIKQAVLCDWYKRRSSIQNDPKTLKFLLKTKLSYEPPDLLMLRRYSDPGHISQPESFVRRKELFIDENQTWSNNHGRVIDNMITKWKARREEKQQRKLLMQKNGHSLKYHLLNTLQPNGVPSNGSHMIQAGYAGLNSYLYPAQSILTPVSGGLVGGQAPVYSPFMTPYMNPYQSVVQVGQQGTYFVPQATNVQGQQKLLYLVPPTSTGGANSVPLISVSNAGQHHHHLSFANPPPQMFSRKESDTGVQKDHDFLIREQYQRRQSVPNNLSSLLVSPLKQFRSCSPPPSKKPHLSDEGSVTNSNQSSRHQLSSRQHHLLQVHRRSKKRSGDSRSTSPQSVDHSSSYSPTASDTMGNGDYNELSDDCDIDETEAERLVGGAVVSPDSQAKYGGPSPHTQLQLWQFLLELLLISANTHLIQWSTNRYEFQINKPLDVAKLWGKVTNIDNMDYHQLLRGLKYYFTKGILSRVKGKELLFRYNLTSIQNYIEERRSSLAYQDELIVVE